MVTNLLVTAAQKNHVQARGYNLFHLSESLFFFLTVSKALSQKSASIIIVIKKV